MAVATCLRVAAEAAGVQELVVWETLVLETLVLENLVLETLHPVVLEVQADLAVESLSRTVLVVQGVQADLVVEFLAKKVLVVLVAWAVENLLRTAVSAVAECFLQTVLMVPAVLVVDSLLRACADELMLNACLCLGCAAHKFRMSANAPCFDFQAAENPVG